MIGTYRNSLIALHSWTYSLNAAQLRHGFSSTIVGHALPNKALPDRDESGTLNSYILFAVIEIFLIFLHPVRGNQESIQLSGTYATEQQLKEEEE